jgi:tripartite-type tricarboxylate transporter receptor subunit TctC
VDSGELRIIAVATPTRWPAIPNVPTLAESGLPGINYLGWYGLAFPAGTPQPIIDRMHKAMQVVLAKDAVKQRLEAIGAVANLSTPAEFRAAIQSDIKAFQEVAKGAGLEAQ